MRAPSPDTPCPYCGKPFGSLNLHCTHQAHPDPDITITLRGSQWQELAQALVDKQVRYQLQQEKDCKDNKKAERWVKAYIAKTDKIIAAIKKRFT